jgi:RNA polymerase sigma-70 factor (ECF subfamily)
VKDPRLGDVSDSGVEPSDAPVMTSEVVTGSVTPAVVPVESIVVEAFDAHAGRLKTFARAAVRDEDAADDLVQETFLRFVREVRAGRTPENVGGWLYRVCANLVASRGRRRTVAERMKGLLVDRSTAGSAEDHAVRSSESVRLREALADLPADARVALLMAAEGFSSAEIGDAIGRTPGATATYICRARVRLRERLGSATDWSS